MTAQCPEIIERRRGEGQSIERVVSATLSRGQRDREVMGSEEMRADEQIACTCESSWDFQETSYR